MLNFKLHASEFVLFAVGGAFADIDVNDAFVIELVGAPKSLNLAFDVSGGGAILGLFAKWEFTWLVMVFRWIERGLDVGGLELGWKSDRRMFAVAADEVDSAARLGCARVFGVDEVVIESVAKLGEVVG